MQVRSIHTPGTGDELYKRGWLLQGTGPALYPLLLVLPSENKPTTTQKVKEASDGK